MENTKSLAEAVRSYLESAGFNLSQEHDCLIADKLIFGAERDTRLVWVTPEGRRTGSYGSHLWESISRVRGHYPSAKATVVAPSREGFSSDLRRTLTQSRVKLLTPIQFFDSPFRVEESPRAASAIADIRQAAESQGRIPQPFEVETDVPKRDQDLFLRLRDDMSDTTDATVRIVVGRAGIGKSFLFNALFADLYREFLAAKRQLRNRPRPIPLLPEHLKQTHSMRTDALIDNFLHTDVAAPMSSETFVWLLVNGYAAWLLDGLDELYAGDPGFFDYLLNLVTTPGSRAQITIWCRDSLLTTSPAFSEFQEVCDDGKTLQIYRLSEWDALSKRRFVWLKKHDRLPNREDGDSDEVRAFLQNLDKNDTLRRMSGLPFYCDLLLQHSESGSIGRFQDEVELLNYAVDTMVNREVEKGLFDRHSFEEDGLSEWLETIAAEYVEEQYAGFGSDQAEEYGQYVLRDGLDHETQRHVLTSLLQFPLFRAGSESGKVAFVHDLIADAVAARHYRKLLGQRPHDVLQRLGRVDIDCPPLLRFIAHGIDEDTANALIPELRRPSKDRWFAVALTLFMLARPARLFLRHARVDLEDRDLVGVRFANIDLSECSFRGSDLSYAVFEECDLRGAALQGARFNRTTFEDSCNLAGAQMGNMSRVHSIVVGRKVKDDIDEVQTWFAEKTGVGSRRQPCPTAQQFMHLFGKYVTSLGRPRRDSLSRRALEAGKRFDGAASMDDCLKAAVRKGYLDERSPRGTYRRTSGDEYAEVVAFVAEAKISNGIGKLIEELCQKPSCSHRL